jgi:hypothetical protein
MKGFLVKRENEWFVKWSDLHSFAHGTHWMYTELSNDSNSLMYIKDGEVKYNVLKEDVEVEFEIITSGYDNKDFTPHNSAKLIFPEVEIFKKLKLIEDYKTVSNVLWSIDRISSLRDGTIMIIRPTLRNANQPLYIHSTNWTIHNGYPATNENLITNETERAYILDRLLQYKKACQFNYNQINHIIQSIKFE